MSHVTWPARVPALVSVAYAAAVYLVFLAVLGYAAGFFAGHGVPKGIDEGTHTAVPYAAAIDVLLLTLFAVQHTVMARLWFKRRWTRLVPHAAERSTYVLAASLILALLYWLWRPIDAVAWSIHGPGAGVLWALYAAGWAVAVSSTFLISHFDLFGLRQAWLHARRGGYSSPPFTERGLYRHIRHPLMAGFVIIFWSAPTMSAGHLLFAAAATGYIVMGIAFEEHDLIRSLGHTYDAYRSRVPALIPRPWSRPGSRRSARQPARPAGPARDAGVVRGSPTPGRPPAPAWRPPWRPSTSSRSSVSNATAPMAPLRTSPRSWLPTPQRAAPSSTSSRKHPTPVRPSPVRRR